MLFLILALCLVFQQALYASPETSTLVQERTGVVKPSIILSPKQIEQIGVKIFDNECAGKDECLLQWDEGENFLSLGIGHVIWYHEGETDGFELIFGILVVIMVVFLQTFTVMSLIVRILVPLFVIL